jgi:hypothetical protein
MTLTDVSEAPTASETSVNKKCSVLNFVIPLCFIHCSTTEAIRWSALLSSHNRSAEPYCGREPIWPCQSPFNSSIVSAVGPLRKMVQARPLLCSNVLRIIKLALFRLMRHVSEVENYPWCYLSKAYQLQKLYTVKWSKSWWKWTELG